MPQERKLERKRKYSSGFTLKLNFLINMEQLAENLAMLIDG
jgi:hypothetical protein